MAHLRAIVDMGSNGIRFSITDLSPATARTMPAIYQDRAGISLYSSQWSTGSKQPIPQKTITGIVHAFQRFVGTCRDFGVPESNIRVVATEATRVALNSEDFIGQIKKATSLTVELLPKVDEGRIGAFGIASSFTSVKGLVMDLGGGSTQITWMITENGHVKISEKGSVSMPYGAAALSIRLEEADKNGTHAVLRKEIVSNFKTAIKDIDLPPELKDSLKEGLSLYLSGGGFRGWGFVLMSQHPVSPYPIPIINGFTTTPAAFHDTETVKAAVESYHTSGDTTTIFRVSHRRASQVPAVAFLVSCLAEALPTIKTVHFCQGGVREGSLYSTLDPSTRSQDPLAIATAASSPPPSVPKLIAFFKSAIPSKLLSFPSSLLTDALLTAFTNSLHTHAPLPKDLRAVSGLRATTSGPLAAVHGVDHLDRAALALLLCERWGGRPALSPNDESFYTRLMALVGPAAAWWCGYLGRIGALLGTVFPAGVVREDTLQIEAREKDPGQIGLEVRFGGNEEVVMYQDGLQKALKEVERVGRRENWPGGEKGCVIDLKVFTDAGKMKGRRWKGKEDEDGNDITGGDGELDD
ncbi:Ppx-GppA-domain-containing protein [Aulographum hederae CBS 113979]|uniref:Ppx-GppA-domain-containing protein n=1 Tax=Aulographum hederae CBS 113979 TaxID=1176131 RepID=A0A6G1GWQ7_9PEZI|nr:Ppx-GppA-domain-containing protein [Aulographum hederae CBS 113979]